MTKEELKQYIDQNVYENQDGDITGEALNDVLKAIVDDGGTKVEANPTGEATDTLGKLKIGGTIYTAPQGPQGEPGEDGQDGQPGPANTLTIGTVTDGEQAAASITGEAPNQQLNLVLPKGEQGDPGQNAVNPFKGWFTTDNIPTTGQEGDYCNVSDTSVTPHTVTIYRWNTTQNAFVDTGEVPDTASGDTFASSEELNQVAIDNSNLDNPVNPADPTKPVLAKAEDVMQLKAKLEGIDLAETKVTLVENTNWFDGKYLNPEGIVKDSTGSYPNGLLVVNVSSFKRLRFLGYYSQNASGTGYGFSALAPDITNTADIQVEDVHEFDYGASVNQAKEYIVDVPEDKPWFVCTIRKYGSSPVMTIGSFYCYQENGNTVMDEINGLKKDFYEYEPLTLQDLGSGYVPGTLAVGENVESQIGSTEYYNVLKVDISDTNDLKVSGRISSTNLARHIYFYADASGNFISKDELRGSSNFQWNDYKLTPPQGAKYLYINAVTSQLQYYTVENLVLKDFLTSIDKAELEDGIYGVQESLDLAKQRVGAEIKTYTIVSGRRLENQLVGKTLTQCEASSSALCYRKYSVGEDGVIAGGETIALTLKYININDSIIPVVWSDENDVIIKVESFRTNASSTVRWKDAIIKAPASAKNLCVNVQLEIEGYYHFNHVDSVNAAQLAKKKVIRVLSIGNSYSQDALAYVPFITRNLGIDVDLDIGILMQSSASLRMHWDNWLNETEAYIYNYKYSIYGQWHTLSEKKSIKQVLELHDWDIVLFQQGSAYAHLLNTYQPYLNQLINAIAAYVNYPIKFAFYAVQSKVVDSANGTCYTDAKIEERWQAIANNAKAMIDTTVCEFLIPVGTAIQNARTIAGIKALGSYAAHNNGIGWLTYEGVHLQEGLPCQIAAYTMVLSILGQYGLSPQINADGTIVDSTFEAGLSIPSPHGSPVGSDETNILIAQKCAIMAYRHPFVTTDMNGIVNPS